MTVDEVIEKINSNDTRNIETFYCSVGDLWADVDLTRAFPAYVFAIRQKQNPIFCVRVRKIEALKWLMLGFSNQHENSKWDYTTDPSDGDGDPQHIF